MSHFDEIYQAAIEKNEEKLKQFPYFDRYKQVRFPFLTVAGLLASENNVDAVRFLQAHDPLIDLDYIAEGYASAGNHEMVLECQRAGINLDAIVQGYAIAKNHEKVAEYLALGAKKANAVAGYLFAGESAIAEEYLRQEPSQELLDAFVWTYAILGNHEQVKFYLNNYQISPDVAAKGYVMGGFHDEALACAKNAASKEIAREIAESITCSYAKRGNKDAVSYFERNFSVSRAFIIKSFCEGRYYEQAAEYLAYTQPFDSELVDDLVWDLAKKGEYTEVERYKNQFKADLTTIVSAYAWGGHEEKLEELISSYPDEELAADAARSYARKGNHAKVNEFQTRFSWINPGFIAVGYELGGYIEQAGVLRQQDLAQGANNEDPVLEHQNNQNEHEPADNLPSNGTWFDGFDMQVLSLFVASVGASAVAIAIAALAFQAVTFPVAATVAAVGAVAAVLGCIGFFKYSAKPAGASSPTVEHTEMSGVSAGVI